MTIRIAHASIDENGKITGGVAGDQTGKEVCIRTWYSKPWQYLIRCRDASMREKIAYAMERACNNAAIGYDQGQRNTLLNYARNVGYDPGKVTQKCETDCSALVTLACIYAGIPENKLVIGRNSATTSTIRNRLLPTGKFEVLTTSNYLRKSEYLLRGDILLKEGSHVVVVLDNGTNANTISSTTSKYSISSNVKSVQTWLNANYKTGIVVDGDFGQKSKSALIKAWQTEVGGLLIDGIFGNKCASAAVNHCIQKGSTGILVTIWQAFLVCNGYNQSAIDGVFGEKCHAATISYQRAKSLYQDGIVGKNTWSKAFS